MYKIEKEDTMSDVKRENLEAYFERLEKLSTEELDQEAQKCVLSEQRSVACVIAHLAEISRREAHLRLGFTSLFDYGVRRLGLSEGSVYLRMQVANVARRFPAILSALAQHRISLAVNWYGGRGGAGSSPYRRKRRVPPFRLCREEPEGGQGVPCGPQAASPRQ